MTRPGAQKPEHLIHPRTFGGVFRPYLKQFAWGVVWLLATNACALAIPSLLNSCVEALRRAEPWQALLPGTAAMAGAALLMAVTRTLSRVLMFSLGRDVEYDLRRDLYLVLSLQQPAFFHQRSTGDLMSRATADLTNVRLMFGFAALNVINTGLVFVGNVPLLIRLDPALAMAALAPYPVMLMTMRTVAKAIFSLTRRNQEDLGAVGTRVQEHLAGMSVVRAFAQEAAEEARFAKVNTAYYTSSLRLAVVRNLLGPVMALAGTATTLIAVWYGAHRMLAGHLSVGGLVEFVGRLAALAWPTLALGWILAVWQRGQASFVRLNEVLSVMPTIVTSAQPRGPAQDGGSVTLQDAGVSRSSRPGTPLVWNLRHVDVNLPARGFVGIAGATGSGKTTLTWLIPRLLEASEGSVTVDGTPVTAWDLHQLRQRVAVAPQEPFLFSSSLRENLCFGRPDATDAEVQEVLNLLGLDTDVASFPQGLDTVVGERGITLSGGQRQRVALGRALLCRPEVLVLDDTLSALDAETEERILTTLRAEAHQRTLVVVSHRLSVFKDADEVVVLDQGQIVERGTHTGLLDAGGAYSDLWGRAKALEELRALEAGNGGPAVGGAA